MINTISPELATHGCSCMQPVHTVGETTYVVTLITHSSGQYLRSVTRIPEQYLMAGKMTSTTENLQALGGAITYVKRHALKAILGIDADDDTDGGAQTYYSNKNNY